jgi:hypothetical protein
MNKVVDLKSGVKIKRSGRIKKSQLIFFGFFFRLAFVCFVCLQVNVK